MAPELSKKQWALSLIILASVLGFVLQQYNQLVRPQAQLTFLDIGQGDAILIQTPEYKNILIDAGPDGRIIERLSQQLNFFNQKIDLFVLTHPDMDHYGGAMDLLQKYPVKSVMLTGVASDSQLYLALLKELKQRNVSIIYPENNVDWQIGKDLFLDILYPFKGQHLLGQSVKNKNNTSVSVMLRNRHGRSFAVLTGDAETELERELLLSGQDLSAPILKLGHHGSKTSSSPPFLAAVDPETVVVSAGKDNKYGHPSPEVLARVTALNLRSTIDEGSITFVLE